MSQSLHGLSVCSLSLKEPSLMTEIEIHEMNEAAMSLVMFSERVYDFDLPPSDDDSVDLDCVESLLDSGFEKSSTCSDVVAQALPSPLNSKLQKTPESRYSYKCNICDKSFRCFQALGGHKTLHRPKLACKREYSTKDDDNSLFDSSEGKKIVSQPSEFEVSQDEKSLHCDELIQDFSEQLPLNSKLLQTVPESSSSYKCNVCGKSFGCYQALGGHKTLHRPSNGKLAPKREYSTKDDHDSLFDSSEFEVFQGEKNLRCDELIQDFSEQLPLYSKLQTVPESSSSYKCNICDKSFECYQALGGHKTLHRPKLACKREYSTKDDDNSLFDSSEAKKIVLQLVSQKEKTLRCDELIQDFNEQLPLNSKLQKLPESSSSYKCNVCDESFGCFQALGGHKTLHRSIKKEYSAKDDDTSLFNSSEAKKIVSQPSQFEVSQKEKSLCCDELIQDFRAQISHSGFDSLVPSTLRSKLERKTQSKSSYDYKICGRSFVCSQDCDLLSDSIEARKTDLQPSSFEDSQEKILHCVEVKQDFSELLSPSTLRTKLQKKTQSKSSYDCNICGKSFVCSQGLGSHKRHHKTIDEKLSRKRKRTEDYNSLSGSSEAKKIDAQH